jgi:quercetin dioxygenase-like cupin family protein
VERTGIIVFSVLIVASGLSLQPAQAQQPGIGRSEILRHDIGKDGRELIQVRVDFAPGAAFGMHTHPGEEVAYVLEGSVEYQIQGSEPITLKAGNSLFIPAGRPHTARNLGSVNATELATYLVEKGKPLVVLDLVNAQ